MRQKKEYDCNRGITNFESVQFGIAGTRIEHEDDDKDLLDYLRKQAGLSRD